MDYEIFRYFLSIGIIYNIKCVWLPSSVVVVTYYVISARVSLHNVHCSDCVHSGGQCLWHKYKHSAPNKRKQMGMMSAVVMTKKTSPRRRCADVTAHRTRWRPLSDLNFCTYTNLLKQPLTDKLLDMSTRSFFTLIWVLIIQTLVKKITLDLISIDADPGWD